MSRLLPALALLAALLLPAAAQTASSADQARQSQLAAASQIEEPGRQLRALQAFAAQYPHAPELADVYNAIIQDAVQLNNDQLVVSYNLKLERLDPANLAQRVKVLNLLLIETDPAHEQEAAAQAAIFAKMVTAKTREKPPAAMGPTRWRLDMARLQALADLFQGASAQALAHFATADKFLAASLDQSQTEQAAQHLGEVLVAEGKIPQAVNAYALALALPGQTISERAALEATAEVLYRQLHQGSKQGFGDLILSQFDNVASRDAAQQAELHPHSQINASAASAGQFVLTSLDGARHTLNQEKGKVVVLDFWATWCGPCKIEHPLLGEVARQFANDHNVIFIAVNEDEDRSRLLPFLEQQQWPKTTWLDAGLGAFLGVDSLPTTLILDRQGTVVYRQEGLAPGTFVATLHRAIARTLRADPPSTR
ncbi:MAG: TlpA family protein disulfide reductase [Terriglobales bacterium]